MAAFLCGVGPYQYYGMGGWSGLGEHGNFSDHWLPGVFDRKVGVGARRSRPLETRVTCSSRVSHV